MYLWSVSSLSLVCYLELYFWQEHNAQPVILLLNQFYEAVLPFENYILLT